MKNSILNMLLVLTLFFSINTVEAAKSCKVKKSSSKTSRRCGIDKKNMKNRKVGKCKEKKNCGAHYSRQNRFAKMSCNPCRG
jgi:hypothetical protein